MDKLQQQFYPVQPVLMAINNIARQIEYYFSEENLTVDNYLRSKLSKDGFAPLSLISKFYRVVNMSFGGDTNLILAALREIVANEAATVNVAEGTLAAKEGDNVTGEAKEPSPLDKYSFVPRAGQTGYQKLLKLKLILKKNWSAMHWTNS